MLFLPVNQQQSSVWLRGLLLIIFTLWLTTVLTQYYLKAPSENVELAKDQTPNQVSIQPLTLPSLPKISQPKHPITKQTAPKITTHVPALKAKPQSKLTRQIPATSEVKQQQVEQVYQQLSASGVDIQLAWPQSSRERQAVFDFMYQCVGMQFAVLNNNQITQLNHTELSDYSDWIRIAQGSLTNQEQNWIHAFALTGTPIRLFPRQIDWSLSHYLANSLKGAPLAKLRANYQVSNQQLKLTNIQLNNQAIKDNWVLFADDCW